MGLLRTLSKKQFSCQLKKQNKGEMKVIKPFFLVIFVLFLTSSVFSEKVAVLTEVLKPEMITIDDFLYVTEGTTIYIFDKKNYKFIRKFGQKGEGPQEFKLFAFIIPQKEHLLINSMGKVSYFTKEGDFIREMKCIGNPNGYRFYPLKNGFIGIGTTSINKTLYDTVNLYDKNFKNKAALFKRPHFDNHGKMKIPPKHLLFQTSNNKIYLAVKTGFIVQVLDEKGRKIHTIERADYKKRKFTIKDKQNYTTYLKNHFKSGYNLAKQHIEYPEYFPVISNIFIDDSYLYIATWKFQEGKLELFQYRTTDWKFMKRFFIKVAMQNTIQQYSISIKSGKIYQLIENEVGDWELHISAF
jgi:hypothetical protein